VSARRHLNSDITRSTDELPSSLPFYPLVKHTDDLTCHLTYILGRDTDRILDLALVNLEFALSFSPLKLTHSSTETACNIYTYSFSLSIFFPKSSVHSLLNERFYIFFKFFYFSSKFRIPTYFYYFFFNFVNTGLTLNLLPI